MTVQPVPHQKRVETLIAAFERQFGRRPEGIAEAPGRVNLIGEHVDYNDGLVLPFAIGRSVVCAWGRRDDDAIWAYAVDMDEHSRFHMSKITHAAPGAWASYTRGVVVSLQRAGFASAGIEIAFEGDVPQGAGLSSSAALEVAVAGAFRDAFSLPIDDVGLARLCQRAENEYVGVQCGIMDQFASALSKRDHALLIDCRTLAYEHIPMRLEEARLAIVIANSGMKRELASSAYNDRRRDCEEAVAMLREGLGRPELASLRDVSAVDLDVALDEDRSTSRGLKARATGTDSVPLRRARHVVTEIGRVVSAVEALRHDDFEELGRLMGESHHSLRDDYQVSSSQLDLLVGLATAREYVAGARLTGAGFGGCTVNLVRADAVEAFERDVIAPYRERTGLEAEMYVTSPQDGLRTWQL
jgi:galactokinase